jgi:hypothetical protein
LENTQDNLIRFGKNGIYADDFKLSKEGSQISLQSQSRKRNAPLAIDFKDLI